ncbi:trypsin, alkaline C-like [Bicyclus anynana]|uniref:Trypsin, alkaline C-like n=1 Tax=Bicyclus anynana TaxID=110368 RepID=A0ABM3LFB5_BICAN|nr:trypsin, alkaline C-like [Bicyclus anynana]
MWKFPILLAICLVTAEAIPKHGRIVGGSTANISQFPFAAVMLISWNNEAFRQDCAGTILNNRSVLSAAHCWVGKYPSGYRVRVGSTNANSGGAVHNVLQHITHPDYYLDMWNIRSDIGIARLATAIVFGGNVRAGPIAGANFNVADNANVWAMGWGLLASGGSLSEPLQHVQLRITNHAACQRAHNAQNVNARTICAGWHENGRGGCTGDSGGPLVHNGVVIGVFSFIGPVCGDIRWPNVYARVSSYVHWIQNNA